MGAFEGEYMSDRDHLTYSREVMTRKYAETYRKREELKLPKRCGAIGDAAFRDNIRIERLALENGLRRIGKDGFRHSVALREARLPESVEKIGDGCFADCPRLRRHIYRSGLRRFRQALSRKTGVYPK